MNLLAQRNAVDELHGDEIHAIAFTNFIDMSDVRMIQSRRGFRLLGKAPHPILIAGEFGGKYFQRHLAIEFRILRQIHLAHSAFANLRADFITAESGSGCGVH
jgi:hypothetical protein